MCACSASRTTLCRGALTHARPRPGRRPRRHPSGTARDPATRRSRSPERIVVHRERPVSYWTMTEPPVPEATPFDRVRANYDAAKARLAEVGFTCEGSLIERYTTCNNPNCRCADPKQRHGPYWQLSWKQAARPSPGFSRPRTPLSTSSGSLTAACSKPLSRRCETSPAKPASRSSPPTAGRSTAPTGPAARPASPSQPRDITPTRGYPWVSRTSKPATRPRNP